MTNEHQTNEKVEADADAELCDFCGRIFAVSKLFSDGECSQVCGGCLDSLTGNVDLTTPDGR